MRNCEYIGNPAMFQSRVSGLGTPVARLDDGTEVTFYPAGLQYRQQATPGQVKWIDGVPTLVDGPPVGPVTMYDLQVTVKNYSPGSGVVTYNTWGRSLYPGFNAGGWKTVSESEFLAMYSEWANVKAKRFGVSAPSPVPTPMPTPAPAPTKPTGFSLPLLLGAAYLLLS
jgi:hypothetical protein